MSVSAFLIVAKAVKAARQRLAHNHPNWVVLDTGVHRGVVSLLVRKPTGELELVST